MVASVAFSSCSIAGSISSSANMSQIDRKSSSINILKKELRDSFFLGPIAEIVQLENFTPDVISDESQIGIHVNFGKRKEYITELVNLAGFKWLRVGSGRWNLPAVLRMAKDSGINVNLVLYGPSRQMVKNPDNIDELSRRWLSERVNPVLEEYPEVIKAVQIHNEPSNFPKIRTNVRGRERVASLWPHSFGGTWYGGGWIKPFTDYTTTASQLIKAKYPRITVVGGVRNINATLAMFGHSSMESVDAIYFHPYPRWSKPEHFPGARAKRYRHFKTRNFEFKDVINDFRSQLSRNVDRENPKIWITEFGVTTYEPDPKIKRRQNQPPASEIMQAKLIARGLMTYLSAGVERAFIFSLNRQLDEGNASKSDVKANFGLLRPDFTIKPAYLTVERLNLLLRGIAKPSSLSSAGVTTISYTQDELELDEKIHFNAYDTGIGRKALAVWSDASTATSEDFFEPRMISFEINELLGSKPVVFDPITGTSEYLRIRRSGDVAIAEIDVFDYPMLIIEN
ncbi:MAG: hypothetical protein AAF704_06955 [Cyanobacteria bacterium P01_D01_bin.123]